VKVARNATFTVKYRVKGSSVGAKTITMYIEQPMKINRAPSGLPSFSKKAIARSLRLWNGWGLSSERVNVNGDGTYDVALQSTDRMNVVMANIGEAPEPAPSDFGTPSTLVPSAAPAGDIGPSAEHEC
jgi:hypothetical protein